MHFRRLDNHGTDQFRTVVAHLRFGDAAVADSLMYQEKQIQIAISHGLKGKNKIKRDRNYCREAVSTRP